jgi:hypothetical protein
LMFFITSLSLSPVELDCSFILRGDYGPV